MESKWEKGINEKDVECLGDLITIDKAGEEAFIHFSTIDEMIDFIIEENFQILYHDYTYNINEENEATKNLLEILFFG